MPNIAFDTSLGVIWLARHSLISVTSIASNKPLEALRPSLEIPVSALSAQLWFAKSAGVIFGLLVDELLFDSSWTVSLSPVSMSTQYRSSAFLHSTDGSISSVTNDQRMLDMSRGESESFEPCDFSSHKRIILRSIECSVCPSGFCPKVAYDQNVIAIALDVMSVPAVLSTDRSIAHQVSTSGDQPIFATPQTEIETS